MNRRCFLRQIGGATAGATCAGLGLAASGCLPFQYAASAVTPEGLTVRKAEFESRRFVLLEAPDGRYPIYLYRSDDGTFSAVSTRCTHRGCPVEPADDHLVCPCHGSAYTNLGVVIQGPADRPLEGFAVRETQDAIVIAWHA